MPVTFEAGLPLAGGRPIVVVAVEPPRPRTPPRLRLAVRELAEDGFTGVWLPPERAEEVEAVADAARRAGLAAVLPAPAAGAHVLLAEPAAVTVAERPEEAYTALMAGRRVIAGTDEAVGGLRAFLALATNPAGWQPLPAPAGWSRRGGGDESGWYGRGPVTLTPTDRPGLALHWVLPATGEVLGLVAVAPGEELELRWPEDEELALYLGPSRYRPDESVARP